MFLKTKTYSSPQSDDLVYRKFLNGGWTLTPPGVFGWQHSGTYLEKMWQKTLKHYAEHTIQRVLILGTGAGCSTHVVHTLWPNAAIDSVDHNPTMFDIEKDVYGTRGTNIRFIESEALAYLQKTGHVYDLIVVDLFKNDHVPELVSQKEFIELLKQRSGGRGSIAINAGFQYPETKTLAELLAKEFPYAQVFRYETNTLILITNRGIPSDFSDAFQTKESLEWLKQAGRKFIFFPKGHATMRKIFGRTFLIHVPYIDEEPDLTHIKQAGAMHGVIFWLPWNHFVRPPRGWFYEPLGTWSTGKGFSVVAPNYQTHWSQSARRDFKKFLKSEVTIRETTQEDFLEQLKHAQTRFGVRSITRSIVKNHRSPETEYRIATKDGVVLGGLSTARFGNSSKHEAAFSTREGFKLNVQTGLVDDWFKRSLEDGVSYLDWGIVSQSTDMKSWKGFSDFKRKFNPQEIRGIPTFVKFF